MKNKVNSLRKTMNILRNFNNNQLYRVIGNKIIFIIIITLIVNDYINIYLKYISSYILLRIIY